MRVLAAALLALVALPFDPFWLDFEAARRSLLLVCSGLLALSAPWWLRGRLPLAAGVLLALGGWHLARSIGTTNPTAGVQRALHLLVLSLWFLLGRRLGAAAALQAALPACIAVSVFGLTQALGFTWPSGYPPRHEPVSTFGNTNYASEFVALGAAAAAALLARREATRRSLATLAIACTYLLVNGSRSGLLALPLACLAVFAGRGSGPRGRLLVVIALLAGTGCGLLLQLARARPPQEPAATPAVAASAPSTVQVRLEIWRGCLAMAGDAPWIGHGAGQFAAEYPRYRTQREIELSTFGRQFAARPFTAHNDHLHLLTETGSIGLLLLWAALALSAAQRRRHLGALAPLVAFLALSLVRDPLGNAPVAALLAAHLGSLHAPDAAGRRHWPLALASALLGVAALVLGVRDLLGAQHAARYQHQRAFPGDGRPAVTLLEDAAALQPGEPAVLRLLAQERFAAGSLDDALQAWARAAAIDPDDTAALVEEARHLQAANRPIEALRRLQRALTLDPHEPSAALAAAAVLCQQGKTAEGLAMLLRDPHPRLREVLAETLAELARHARARGDDASAELLDLEHAWVAALDALARAPVALATKTAITHLNELQATAGARDLRPFALLAIYAVGVGETASALALARAAREGNLAMAAAHRRLLGELAEPLLTIGEWRALLERRD